jgi:hypothetical protein
MYSFTVQVVPNVNVRQFALVPSRNNSEVAAINLRELRDYVSASLDNENPQNLECSITVALVGMSTAKVPEDYHKHIDEEAGKALEETYNHLVSLETSPEEEKEWLFKVNVSVFSHARIVITPTPYSIARRHYKWPELEPLQPLGYHIDIYQRNNTRALNEVNQYFYELDVYNSKLALPLELAAPGYAVEFEDASSIIFLARRNTDNAMIGYCFCVFLRYRDEIKRVLENELNALFEEQKTLDRRYFMGVRPHHFYEIKGLSVMPQEAGKNVGLALLYHALHFIQDKEVARFLPVTHVTAQSASYITKRLLLNYFEFRYHGTNIFFNEHFVETLSTEAKTSVVRVLTELVTNFNILIQGPGTPTILRQWISSQKMDARIKIDLILKLVQDAIFLYQLYFLLLKTGARSQALSCYNEETLNAFIPLFEQLQSLLSVRGERFYFALREYLEENIKSMRVYIKSRDLVATLESTVILRNREFRNYGFLTVFTKKQQGQHPTKVIYSQSYDVLYETLPNTLAFIVALIQTKPDERKRLLPMMVIILNLLQTLIASDIPKQYNYEVPVIQWEAILDAIQKVITITTKSQLKELQKEGEALGQLARQIQSKRTLLKKNADVNGRFTIHFLNIPAKETSGVDTVISYQKLVDDHEAARQRYYTRIGYVESEIEIDVLCPSASQTLVSAPLTANLAQLQEEFTELHSLLKDLPSRNTMLLFKNELHSVGELEEYFNRLATLLSSSVTMESSEMIVEEEEEAAAEATYELKEFIDVNLMMSLSSSSSNNSLLNKHSI